MKNKLSADEQGLIQAYRAIEAQWERLALLMIIKSVAYGHFTKKTDRYSWRQISRMVHER